MSTIASGREAQSVSANPHGRILTRGEVLAAIPHRAPFRFVTSILSIDRDAVTATAVFPADSFFYEGHFPSHPVTPGAILLETMAQAALAPLTIYRLAAEHGLEAAAGIHPRFTDAQVEFRRAVAPGERVTLCGEVVFFRRGKLRARVDLLSSSGELACSGVLSGIGLPQ